MSLPCLETGVRTEAAAAQIDAESVSGWGLGEPAGCPEIPLRDSVSLLSCNLPTTASTTVRWFRMGEQPLSLVSK